MTNDAYSRLPSKLLWQRLCYKTLNQDVDWERNDYTRLQKPPIRQ